MMRSHKHKWKDIINYAIPLFTKVTVGSGDDRAEIDADGIMLYGDSTVWEDLSTSLIGQRLNSVSGAVDYNYDNNSITFQSGGSISSTGDRVAWNLQHPHGAKQDGLFNLHIHWEQVDSTAREFTVQYRIQDNGDTKETSWTTVVVDTSASSLFTYSSGTLNQITELVSIDMSGHSISAVVQFRLARTDSVSGDIEATFVDVHYELDTMGSRDEYVK
jgi:hypothetical protein